MEGKIEYRFSGMIWQYPAQGGWHFISLPKIISSEIRSNLKWQEEGWGRLKAKAQIGSSAWETAIWFDTKLDTYLLPVKAEIRKSERLDVEKKIKVMIWV
jgi:hypothetical protein